MSCRVEKSELSGEIACPASKSYTHRAIFMGALSGRSTIRNVLDSADTQATVDACLALGAQIRRDGDTVTVISPVTLERDCIIDAKNSGTTIRIAAGIAALSPSTTTLSGDASIRGRPMQPVLDALEAMGARCTSAGGRPPITIQGRIPGGEVSIPGDVSSQFVTSLLICAPLTDSGITVNIEGRLVSRPYLEATIRAMERFGVRVKTIGRYQKYRIEPQQYQDAEFTVPPDASSLALLLAASVLVGKNMSIRAPRSDLPQADMAFLGILGELGAQVRADGDVITASSPEGLRGGSFDLSDAPDLLPPLSILALRCKSPLEITSVEHARHKETDRIAVICEELAKIGVGVEERRDGMRLEPGDALHGAHLDSKNDHRLFMAFSIAAMYVGGCTVSDPGSVSVSYPGYVQAMQGIGAGLMVQGQDHLESTP